MCQFNYDVGNPHSVLEELEWDNLWLENTKLSSPKRVLYVGDSISCGTRRLATQASDNQVLFDGFASSKSLDNPYLQSCISLFLQQEGHCDAILFNNGLHGWHLYGEDYKLYYEKMIRYFLFECRKKLILILTTDVQNNENMTTRVLKRNEIVRELAEKYSLQTVDFFSLSREISHHHTSDGVHFDNEGYEALAKYLWEHIQNNL